MSYSGGTQQPGRHRKISKSHGRAALRSTNEFQQQQQLKPQPHMPNQIDVQTLPKGSKEPQSECEKNRMAYKVQAASSLQVKSTTMDTRCRTEACYLLHGGPTKLKISDNSASARRGDSKEKRKTNKHEVGTGHQSKLTDFSACQQNQSASIGTSRMQAFDIVWKNMETIIKDALSAQHACIFKKLQQWVYDRKFHDAQLKLYYAAGGKSSKADFSNSKSWLGQSQSISVASNRIHTALLFVGTIDSSDSKVLFDGLATYMKENYCHVARLQPTDLSSRAIIHGALHSLFKQFIQHNPDTTDMEILAAWHLQKENQDYPIVIIIEDAECCNSTVLAELIVVLSEWATRLPLVLIMGMSTTCASLKRLLPSRALRRLHPQCFSLKSPTEHLDAIFKALLMDSSSIFTLGYDVAEFLFKFFFTHDNNVSFLLRSMKIACIEHFCKEPSSFLCADILQARNQENFEECCNNLSVNWFDYAASLDSTKTLVEKEQNVSKQLATTLWKVRMNKPIWTTVLLCLYEVGKYFGLTFADIFCGALRPCKSLDFMAPFEKDFILADIILKIRDLPLARFSSILEEWNRLTVHIEELNAEVASIHSKMVVKVNQTGRGDEKLEELVISERIESLLSKKQAGFKSEFYAIKIMAADLLERLYRKHLIPPEALPFHEVFCFTDVNLLKQAISAQTCKQIHADLLASHDYIQCKCCSPEKALSSSMHDTSLLYGLAQKSDNFINVHDLFEAFSTVFSSAKHPHKGPDKKSTKRKRGPSQKIPEITEKHLQLDKASIQARFSRAITELQIVGLFRMPTKKRPDHVQRLFPTQIHISVEQSTV